MKLIFALIFVAVWQQQTNADNYIKGTREPWDIPLVNKQISVEDILRYEEYSGFANFGPYRITRVAIHDWLNSTQKITEGGVGTNYFKMLRIKGEDDPYIGYDIYIYGKLPADIE